MSPARNSKLTPRVLRILLAVFLLVILGVSAAGFTYAQKELLGYAKEISRKKVDANASNSTIATLEKVQEELQGYDDVKQKIAALRSSDEFPEFRVVDEVNKIASRNNIPITSFSYGDSAVDPATGAATPTPTPATPAAPTTAPVASSKTISLTINFGPINNYQDYLQFLYDIEQNVPKMRVKAVSISSGAAQTTGDTTSDSSQTDSSGTGLSIQPLTIELYTQ